MSEEKKKACEVEDAGGGAGAVVNVVKEQRALSGHARWAGHARGRRT